MSDDNIFFMNINQDKMWRLKQCPSLAILYFATNMILEI